MKEQREITLNGQVIPYEIQYKKIKNCYLRIEQGQVKISTSRLYSLQEIENLIRKNQDMVLKQVASYHPFVQYQNNGYVYLFDKKYNLVVRDFKLKKCVIHENDIYVYSARIQETVDCFFKEQLSQYLEKRIQDYLQNDFFMKMPAIQIKKMKSRWGACYYRNHKICFSLNLIYIDKELIDYVIVHELCHFIEANHSKQFYHEIEKRIPDYRDKEKRLKEIII